MYEWTIRPGRTGAGVKIGVSLTGSERPAQTFARTEQTPRGLSPGLITRPASDMVSGYGPLAAHTPILDAVCRWPGS